MPLHAEESGDCRVTSPRHWCGLEHTRLEWGVGPCRAGAAKHLEEVAYGWLWAVKRRYFEGDFVSFMVKVSLLA
jgi:hypothetical protein